MIRALLAVLAVLALESCALFPIPPDAGPHAIDAGDPTALLSGCGSTANVGYLYCRLPEGWTPAGEIRINIPPVKCGLTECARVAVFRSDGGRAVDVAVPEGVTSFSVPWTSLLGTQPIEQSARGFWPVLVKWVWLNDDGLLEQAIVEGEIRLRVYKASYQPLGAEPARWTWQLGKLTLRATEKGRTFVEARP